MTLVHSSSLETKHRVPVPLGPLGSRGCTDGKIDGVPSHPPDLLLDLLILLDPHRLQGFLCTDFHEKNVIFGVDLLGTLPNIFTYKHII